MTHTLLNYIRIKEKDYFGFERILTAFVRGLLSFYNVRNLKISFLVKLTKQINIILMFSLDSNSLIFIIETQRV